MDYKQELLRLEQNESQAASDFWKPEAGQYRVKALSEIEDSTPYEEEGKEPQPRRKISLQIGANRVMWTMPYGITPASTYGQLVKLGSLRGQLKDVEFTVVVTGSGKTKRFTIVA